MASVDLWCWFTTALASSDVAALAEGLANDERVRVEACVQERDRRDRVAAYALVRHALSRHAACEPRDWRFARDTHGKPFVCGPVPGALPLAFSLSHAPGLVACAVAFGRPVGVDVEAVRPRVHADRTAREQFAPAEAEALEALVGDAHAARFIDLWTLHEAYVKGVGTGLWGPAIPPVRFSFDGPEGLQCLRGDGAAPWEFALLGPEGYRLAVAIELPAMAAPHWSLAVNVVDLPSGALEGTVPGPSGAFCGPIRSTGGLTIDRPTGHGAADIRLAARPPGSDSGQRG